MKIDDFFSSSKTFKFLEVSNINNLEYEFKRKCFCEFSDISAIACSSNFNDFNDLNLNKKISFMSQIKFWDIDVILKYDLVSISKYDSSNILYTFKLKNCTYF